MPAVALSCYYSLPVMTLFSRSLVRSEATGALGPSAKALLWRVASNDDAAPDIRSVRYRYYICRLSVVLKASAYTMYKRYLTKCVDSLKPADGE